MAAQVYYLLFSVHSAPYSLQFSSIIKTRLLIPITKIHQLKDHHSCTVVVHSMRKAIKYFTPSPVVVVVVGSVVVVAVVVVGSKTQQCK